MGYIIFILATLAAGIAVGYRDNGSTLTAQSGRTSGILPWTSPSRDLGYTAIPKFSTKTSDRLQEMKTISRRDGSQNRSGKHVLPRSMAVESLMDEEFQPLLVTRTVRKSASSSESWSGASSRAKRKVDRQLLQHDLTWGQSEAQAKPSNNAQATANRKSQGYENPSPPNKKLKSSVKGLSDGSREATSKSKAKSSSKNQSGSEAKGRVSDFKQAQTDGVAKSLPRRGSRTSVQQAQRNQRQQELREEQKRKLKSGDPEAIKKQAEINARRRELEHQRRARSGDPIVILPPKTNEKDRALGRAKTARYRARKRGDLKPKTFKTSPEERAKSREKMRRRRARERGLPLGDEELSLPTTTQGNKRQQRRLSNLGNSKQQESSLSPSLSSSSSESEWKSSGRSDEPDISASSASLSDRQTSRETRHRLLSDMSSPKPSISGSQAPTRYGSVSIGKGMGGSIEEGTRGTGQQQNEQRTALNNVQSSSEVTLAALQGQKSLDRNSPTDSKQPAQQLHLPSPSRSPNPLQGLTQPSSPGQLQDNLSGFLRPTSPLPFISQGQLPTPTIAQQLHDTWRQQPVGDELMWQFTPPMSPLSFGSAPSLDITRPNSPNPRRL